MSKRNKRKRRSKKPYMVLFLFMLIGGSIFFGIRKRQTPVKGFPVEKIHIEGSEKITEEEILTMTGAKEGTRLLEGEKLVMKERLLESEWIRDAQIKEGFGGTLIIAVKEHEPIAIIRRSAPSLLCSDGTVIPFDEEFSALPTVYIHGKIDFSSIPARIAMIRDILGTAEPLVIHFRGNERTSVSYADINLRIGSNEPLPIKGELQEAIAEMKKNGYRICDMRFKDQIIFEKGGAL